MGAEVEPDLSAGLRSDPSPDPFVCLEQEHVAVAQRVRGGQPGDAATDDDDLVLLVVGRARHGGEDYSGSASASSVATSATRMSAPFCRTPSSSITVQNGQATASVPAPVAAASRARSSLI